MFNRGGKKGLTVKNTDGDIEKIKMLENNNTSKVLVVCIAVSVLNTKNGIFNGQIE